MMLRDSGKENWDEEAAEFLFGQNTPWWIKSSVLRAVFYLPLRLVDRNFVKWSKARMSPRKFRKIQDKLDREYPPGKYSPENLIGREKEFNLLIDAFRLHVLRHPILSRWFGRDEIPKAICLTGESGTGKTFLTMVTMKQMLLEAHRHGVLVSPFVVKGSDIFSEYYGRSTKQLSKILEQAASVPSVVYIDEFQSIGRKVRGDTGTELEDTRVQDEMNRWLDRVLAGKSRTLVIVATNAYEQTREDIRRRLVRVDLDSGVTREMLLALIQSLLDKENWKDVSPVVILEILEREATIRRRGSITPNDVLAVFREVRKSKEIPLLDSIRRNLPTAFSRVPKPRIRPSIDDFIEASKSMKFYSDQEKSREIMDAVYLVKPKETRDEIGGLHDVKDRMLNHIALAFNPKMTELGYNSNCRFLLLGPPGTGKTLLALVAAAENNVNFIKVRGGELMSGASFVGEPEKRIKDLFSLARQKSPCILFLDEADAIFWGADPSTNKVLAQVKSEISEIKPEDGIVIIATSNKDQLIDQATRDRFEPNIYYVHPPQSDQEWTEVIQIHLNRLKRYLGSDVEASKITRLFRRQRIVSPRAAAETIAEAHRLWASELSAIEEIRQSSDSQAVERKYGRDLERVRALLPSFSMSTAVSDATGISAASYLITMKHFQWAITTLERMQDVQQRLLAESLIQRSPPPGVSHGLYTTTEGSGGILTVECSIRPAGAGEPRVTVTGHGSSTIIGQTAAPDDSVLQSAQNAAEAVRSWLWEKTGLNLSDSHVHFQIRSIMEGAPTGVSGPSAGLAMTCALISELSSMAIGPNTVMTGTVGIKMDIGPVGGLGGFGSDTGKLIGILKTQRVEITDLILPKINYEIAQDEMRALEEESIKVHAIYSVIEAFRILFGMEEEIIERIQQRMLPTIATAAEFGKRKE